MHRLSIGHMIITAEVMETIMAEIIMLADITIVMIIVLQLHILLDTTIRHSPRTTLVRRIIMVTQVMTIPVLIIPVRMIPAITAIMVTMVTVAVVMTTITMVLTAHIPEMVIRIVQHQ